MFGEGFTYAFKDSWQSGKRHIRLNFQERHLARSKGPQEFYEMVTENGEAEAKQFYATAEKEK